MLMKEATSHLTKSELAHIGNGEVAYIRKMRTEEVAKCFPEAPDIDPNVDLWVFRKASQTTCCTAVTSTAATSPSPWTA